MTPQHPSSEPSPKTRVVLFAVAMVVVASYAGYAMYRTVDPALTDSTADWLVVTAAFKGVDPWQDLRDLATTFDVAYEPVGVGEMGEDAQFVHPRTPGALLLLLPIVTLDTASVYVWALVAITLAYLGTVALFVRNRGLGSTHGVVLVGLLGVLTTSYLATVEYGTHSAFLMLSLGAMWLSLREKDGILGGLALGLAGILRVFPLLLVIPLLMHGRRKAAATAIAVFAAVNVCGVLLFDLSLAGAAEALSVAGDTWMGFSGNGSIAMPLVRMGLPEDVVSFLVMVAAVVLTLIFSRKRVPLEKTIGPVVMVSLLFSPLSWDHYDLLALLVAGLALLHVRDFRRDRVAIMIGVWYLLQVVAIVVNRLRFSPDFTPAGLFTIIGRVVLLVALVLIWLRDRGDTGAQTRFSGGA